MKLLNIKCIKVVMSMLIAIFVLLAVPYATTVTNTYHSMHYGIISVLVYSLFVFVIYKALYLLKDKRLMIVSCILGFMFSSMLIIGKLVLTYAQNIPKKSIFLQIISLAILFASIIAIILNYLPKLKYVLHNNFIQNKFNKFFDNPSYKYFFIVWVIIFICFIPVLLATFPGIWCYDAFAQLYQYQVKSITSFHPPLHTLLIGFCFDFGKILYHKNPDLAGVLIYSLVQMLVMSGVFAYCCYFLAKIKVPIIIQILSIIFFGLFPVNQIFAVSPTKDVIFAGLMLLILIFVYEAIIDRKKFFCSYFLQIRFIVFVVLACLFRNNEVYAFLLCVPFLLVAFRKYLFKISAICLICLICYFSFTGPIYKLFNIGKGSSAEALSIPIHQLSRIIYYHNDELNANEYSINELFKNTTPYSISSADYEKANFKSDVFFNSKKDYLKLYFELGLKYPKDYVIAFLDNTIASYYPDWTYTAPSIYNENNSLYNHFKYIEYNNHEKGEIFAFSNDAKYIERKSLAPHLNFILESLIEKEQYQHLPIVSILFSQGFYIWFMFLAIAICIYNKRYWLTLPMLFLLALWFTFLFGPVALVRYSYPLFISFPLMISIILSSYKNNPDISD